MSRPLPAACHDDPNRDVAGTMSTMTDLLARSAARVPGRLPGGGHPRPVAVGALLAAGWALLAGALPCAALAVIGWFATTGGTASWALRVGADAWLLAHWIPVDLTSGRFSLPPLGLSLLPIVLLWRAGGWVARSCAVKSRAEVCVGVVTLTVVYAGLVTLVAVLARADQAAPDILRAVVHGGVLAGVVGGAGVLWVSGQGIRLWRRLPEEVRAVLYGGATGAFALVIGGILLVAASLLVHAGRIVELARGLAPGVVGLILLLLLCVCYLPNAAVFAGAFALGPGFAVGTGTLVAPTGVSLGPVPAFPLLAALPVSPHPPGWVMGVLALPMAAGVLAGVVALRRFPAFSPEATALRGGLAGVVGGLGFTVATVLAGGSVGAGRLADVGVPLLPAALISASTCGIAGAVGVLALRGVRWVWSRVRPDADPAGDPFARLRSLVPRDGGPAGSNEPGLPVQRRGRTERDHPGAGAARDEPPTQ